MTQYTERHHDHLLRELQLEFWFWGHFDCKTLWDSWVFEPWSCLSAVQRQPWHTEGWLSR